MAQRDDLLQVLRTLRFPGFRRDLVSLGVIADLTVAPDALEIRLDPPAGTDDSTLRTIEEQIRGALAERFPGLPSVRFAQKSAPTAPRSELPLAGARPSNAAAGSATPDLLPGVATTLAVASGKGGVGKSTVAVNLAVAFATKGLRVGLLDADIYGPSIPTMMGSNERPRQTPERKLIPFERHGVRFMSLGSLIDPDQAVIWRGPMVMKALDQLMRDVDWGELDLLVFDLPPGTGDAQLTLSQRLQLSGAVVVTTPQDVALADAIKGYAMFQRVGVPVLGFIENMSRFVCPHCSEESTIFGSGGPEREAARLGVPLLGSIPLDPVVRQGGDQGTPVVADRPDSAAGKVFLEIAELLRAAGDSPAEKPPGAGSSGLFDRFLRLASRYTGGGLPTDRRG